MRIGIEAQRIFRSKKHGMDIVALELIKALQQLDHANEYFIFVQKGKENTCISQTDNFKIIEVPGLTYADWEQIFLPLYARHFSLDVLHCTSNTAPLFCSTPTIITLHDVIFLENTRTSDHLFNWYQELGRVYRKYIVPFSVRKTKKIITVSHYEKDRILKTIKLGEEKVSVVYNAFGSHFRQNDTTSISAIKCKYSLPDKYIFYIGNTDPKKNMYNTFLAYSGYANSVADPLPLVIADVTEQNLQHMLQQTKLEPYAQLFILTGYIDNKDLPLIYAGADLFLYPSLRESFGIPLLEAMACGTPVITSVTSALPEVAGNAALLINPENQAEIAYSIRSVLTNDKLREDLIAKGLDRIKNFSWNISATQLLHTYQNI